MAKALGGLQGNWMRGPLTIQLPQPKTLIAQVV